MAYAIWQHRFGQPSGEKRAGSNPVKCSAAQKRVRKPRKGQKVPAATGVVNKPAQKAQSRGKASDPLNTYKV
jgi:hypothetical protein